MEVFCGAARGAGGDGIDARLRERIDVLARWREGLAASAASPARDILVYVKG